MGSTPKYVEHFKGELTDGRIFDKSMEVVVGATVAANLELKVGDSFASSHGFEEDGHTHDDQKYTVVGILKYSNSVLDNLLVSDLALSLIHI